MSIDHMTTEPAVLRADAIILASTIDQRYRGYVSHMIRNYLGTACGRLEYASERDSITNIKSDIQAARKALADMVHDMGEVLI